MAEGRDYNVGQYLARPLLSTVSLTKDHLVLEIDTNGKLILATNTGTPYAIASKSTQDKVARTAGITQFVTGPTADIAVFRSGIAELELGSTNLAIKVGDRIVVHADDDGTVNGAADEASVADILLTVGFAEEVIAVNAGGKVLVALKLPMGVSP